ncbi:MAG: hypothetical protein IJW92_00630 [Clostridia bacterium]|nr:hypothetical protein [Clostridia bacterium]
MAQNQFNDFPWMPFEEPSHEPQDHKRKEKKVSVPVLCSILCIAVALTVLLTYTMTAAAKRAEYSKKLQDQQTTIQSMQALLDQMSESSGLEKLELISMIFENYSYYAEQMDSEEMLDAVLKAYAAASGDDYAEYYTEEEYAALTADNVGNYVGVGISVVQTTLVVEGYEYQTFQVIAVYENAPAAAKDLRVGDHIYGVKKDGSYLTVAALGGYTAGLNAIRGEAGTDVEFVAFRKTENSYESKEFCITRAPFVSHSVSYTRADDDPTVGIVSIMQFDMTTPTQLKEAVNALLDDGVESFVFDVRNNPGGDLQSIKAVLTYFLEEGDVILSAVDRDGKIARSYYAEAMTLSGDYASCSVTRSEIGMYKDLDMVVLCNENTASAAEVFTATMRDYGKAEIVGTTTFGKGIMQTFLSLSSISYGNFDGYIKLTTYAYVTQCGIPYQDIGITPDVVEELSAEAQQYNIYLIPQAADNQLQAAIAALKN